MDLLVILQATDEPRRRAKWTDLQQPHVLDFTSSTVPRLSFTLPTYFSSLSLLCLHLLP
jgi:hypothetical protein